MPYRRPYRRYRRKTNRRYTRKRRTSKSKPSSSRIVAYNRYPKPYRSLSGLPQTKMVRLRYVQQFAINALTGGMTAQQFRTNSLQDPDITGAGHQPYASDQWAALYRKYEVLGSKITVQFTSTVDTATTGTVIVGIEQDDTTGYNSNPALQLEQGKTKYKMLSVANGAIPVTTLRSGWSWKTYSRKTGVTSHTDNIASFGSNPALAQTYHVLVGAINPTQDPQGLWCMATIDFIVKLSEVNDFAQS